MITIKNINKIIDILKLVRNSTALMDLINNPDFGNIFNKEIFNSKNISKIMSNAKVYTLYKIFYESGYISKILDGNVEELSKEITLDYTLDTLYHVLKEYSETKFDEENINNENN